MGSHSKSQVKRDVDKLRTTERRHPRTCKELEEVIYHGVIYHEDLNEFTASSRKQMTNEVI